MSLQYIIDGYNIINHPQFTRGHKDTQGPAQSLLQFIRNSHLTGSPKNKITLVFDGYPPAGEGQTNSEVLFSRKISADEKIKMLIEERADRKNMVVVSDDREIRLAVRSLGAQCVGVGDFIGNKTEASKIRPKGSVAPELSYTQKHKINEELKKLWLK